MPCHNKLVRLAIRFIFIFIGLLFIFNCGKPADQKAYEEILATMSMEKAKGFFDNYPESQYRDKLISEIIGWCQNENTDECYKIAIDTLPKDHPQYNKIIIYYNEHFDRGK
jgi:hypothetical protein